MSLMNEYINKRWNNVQFEKELTGLIKNYNEIRKTYMIVYASAMEKPVQEKMLLQEDYYTIHDLLRNVNDSKSLDFFLETGGGVGEVAEEIVKFIHGKFESVSFVIAGQAKSAGTIMALSGDEILMTDTASLGPIDAQIKIGRGVNSSYDYIEWVDSKRIEAQDVGKINPLDAIVIAQITPGELNGVINTHHYAQDLVKDWLVNYKFKNWKTTETRKKPVTEEMKHEQAEDIAAQLTNRGRWRTHNRSIKIDDLHGLGLKIQRIDDNPQLSDIVYKIHTVCRFLFDMTPTIKVFATADHKIFRNAHTAPAPGAIKNLIAQAQKLDSVVIEQACPRCGQKYSLYSKFTNDPTIDAKMKQEGRIPFPDGNKLACQCGEKIDLTHIKTQIQRQTGRKLLIN